MSESLQAACGQFEQVVLAQMLRTAGIGRPIDDERDDDDDRGPFDDQTSSESAFSQLVVQALSGALERAGGIGLRRSLAAVLEEGTR